MAIIEAIIKVKKIDFEMGPGVKFVSPNKGFISGGGVRGSFGKRPYSFPIFFLNHSFKKLRSSVGPHMSISQNPIGQPNFSSVQTKKIASFSL